MFSQLCILFLEQTLSHYRYGNNLNHCHSTMATHFIIVTVVWKLTTAASHCDVKKLYHYQSTMAASHLTLTVWCKTNYITVTMVTSQKGIKFEYLWCKRCWVLPRSHWAPVNPYVHTQRFGATHLPPFKHPDSHTATHTHTRNTQYSIIHQCRHTNQP